MTDLEVFHAAQSARVTAHVQRDPRAPTWHLIAPEGEARVRALQAWHLTPANVD